MTDTTKPKAFLQIWGGNKTIGGNQIFLFSSRMHGIIFDFGWDFSRSSQFFNDFMQYRSHQILNDTLLIGELPPATDERFGIYREDLYKYMEQDFADEFGITPGPPSCVKDLFLSHAHADHIGNVQYLHPDIQLYCSPFTLALLEHFEFLHASTSLFRSILTYKPLFQLSPSDSRGTVRTSSQKMETISRKVHILQSGESVRCAEGDFQVTRYDVDHSIPGASAFLIQEFPTKKKLVYTGDFRLHGPQEATSRNFIHHAMKFSPDFLIMEGTRLTNFEEDDECLSENMIQSRLTSLFQEIDPQKPIFFDCSNRDIWRFHSFLQATMNTSREFVVPGKIHNLLQMTIQHHLLPIDESHMKRVKVYLPKKSWGLYEDRDYTQSPENKYVMQLDSKIVLKAADIRQNSGHYVMYLPFLSMIEFLDLRPPSNAYYIISKSEPFNDEGEIEFQKFMNWMRLVQIPEKNIIRLHCSGHIRREQMRDVINDIHPQILIPIHSEQPEEFTHLGLKSDIHIIIPNKGEKIFL